MTLDRHAAERQRFARVLGLDGELGSGLPIGPESRLDRSARVRSANGDDGERTTDRQ